MNEDYVVVFAGLAMEAELMKAALEAAGIDSFLKGELMGSIAPWTAGGIDAVQLVVRSEDAAEARALLAGPDADAST